MKKSLRIWILCLIIYVSLFSSCINSIDDLYDQYNENFKKNSLLEYLSSNNSSVIGINEEEEQKTPDDPDFDENEMLFDEYFVYNDGTLNLAAPPRCYNYKWVLRDPEKGYEEVKILKYWEGSGPDQRLFVIYVPETGLESKTYQLTLTVYNKEEKPFSDVCGIIIYDHYEYKKDDGSTVIIPRTDNEL